MQKIFMWYIKVETHKGENLQGYVSKPDLTVALLQLLNNPQKWSKITIINSENEVRLDGNV